MDYEAILTEAFEAATAAILAKFKAGDEEHPFNCGFAWVTIDGTSPLARHCREKVNAAKKHANGERGHAALAECQQFYGDKGYPSGWQWWGPGDWPSKEIIGRTVYGQDMDFMYAGALAFMNTLAKHGIAATCGARLD